MPETKPRLTLEQERMKVAYDTTKSAIDPAGETKASKDDWKNVVMPFGTSVQRSGLLQAIAFLQRETDKGTLAVARKELLKTLRKHLVDRGFLLGGDATGELLDIAGRLDASKYMFVTREVLAISIWYKRAAQALCGDDAK